MRAAILKQEGAVIVIWLAGLAQTMVVKLKSSVVSLLLGVHLLSQREATCLLGRLVVMMVVVIGRLLLLLLARR